MASPESPGSLPAARERWLCRLRATLTGHSDAIRALAWGQLGDQPVLASAAADRTVRLWDPEIERFEDRLPGYQSDDPGGPDRLNRDPEAANSGQRAKQFI